MQIMFMIQESSHQTNTFKTTVIIFTEVPPTPPIIWSFAPEHLYINSARVVPPSLRREQMNLQSGIFHNTSLRKEIFKNKRLEVRFAQQKTKSQPHHSSQFRYCQSKLISLKQATHSDPSTTIQEQYSIRKTLLVISHFPPLAPVLHCN